MDKQVEPPQVVDSLGRPVKRRAEQSDRFGQYVKSERKARKLSCEYCAALAVERKHVTHMGTTAWRHMEERPREMVSRKMVDMVIDVLGLDRKEAYIMAGLSVESTDLLLGMPTSTRFRFSQLTSHQQESICKLIDQTWNENRRVSRKPKDQQSLEL